MTRSSFSFLIALCILFAAPLSPRADQLTDGFRGFLETDIWPAAQARGVSRAVFDAAFAGVTPDLKLPDLTLPGKKARVEEKNFQAEFRSPSAYFDETAVARTAARGRALLEKHASTLGRIERAYGVPAPILVAIWGRESGFGSAKIPHNAFRVLGTKAYLSRRKEMFREELLAALEIVAKGHAKGSDLRSSWAGALGQPQFMPSKFLELAVDFDGDGKRDIWNSVPDTLASIANYLKASGWISGRDWGFEANVPDAISCAGEGPDRARRIADFVDAGATRVSGRPFPASELAASGNLLMPAGRYGPAFIATPNFYVLKTYNNSDLYALFIGHTADRMSGGGAFRGGWVETSPMTRGDVARMQEKLVARGYDVGGADGLPGFKTRRAIGDFEAKAGLNVGCWPTRATAEKLG